MKNLYKQLCKHILTPEQIEKATQLMRKEGLRFDALLNDGSIELISEDRRTLVYVERNGSSSNK